MHPTYGRSKLLRIYRRYARRVGWTDHPMAALERVELWLQTGRGAVGDAIQYHQHRARLHAVVRKKLTAGVAMLLTSAAGAWVWLNA